MSRHIIPNAPGSAKHRMTVVGWDAPLATFFAQVIDSSGEDYDEDELLAIGQTPCEVPTIGDLARALGEHDIDLPIDVARQLGEDHTAEGTAFADRPATGLLAAMAERYAGPEQMARISAALTGQDQAGDAR